MKAKLFLVGFIMIARLAPALAAQFGDFTYESDGTAITITRYTGPGGAVTIPDTINGLRVTRIGDYAFSWHGNLTSVTISDSVTSIGVSTFHGCTGFTNIEVHPLNRVYSSSEGVLFNKKGGILIQCPNGKAGNYTIPDSVTEIGYAAFSGRTGLGNVTIPNSVTSIGDYAFSGCAGLTRITIPNSVVSIGGGAFRDCTSLRSVNIPNSVTCIETWTFNHCTSLTDLTIGSSVTSIGQEAFYMCTGLTNVTIPDSVTTLGESAFEECSSLASAKIGNSVTKIGGRAFAWCRRLTSVTIGKGVKSIEGAAFAYCTSLTNVTIPHSVTRIRGGYWREEERRVVGGAFDLCTSLTDLTIGSSVTSIGDGAFWGCSSLRRVHFSGPCPSLGGDAFSRADNATVYYLPGTTGWGSRFGDLPTALWVRPEPVILDFGPSFGVQTNGFGFRISWATNANAVVEAAADMVNPTWSLVSTNALKDGWVDFRDHDWAQYPARFYRVRSE